MQKGLIKEVIAKQSQEKESLSRLKYVDRTKAVKGPECMSSPLVKIVLESYCLCWQIGIFSHIT